MHKHDIRSPADGLAYLVECTLATVITLSDRKSPPKTELRTQIGIAQAGIDCMRTYKVPVTGAYVREVVEKDNWSVEAWSKRYKRT